MRTKNTTYLYRLRKVCACTRHGRLLNKLHFLFDAVMFTVYFTHEIVV